MAGSIAALALLCVAALTPSPAWAGAAGIIEDYEVRDETSAKSSSQTKRVRPACPEGTFEFGAGASMTNLPGLALNLLGAGPPPGFMGGAETDAVGNDWKVTGEKYCADINGPQPIEGAAADNFKAVEVINSIVFSSDAKKAATASCPAGKMAVSGGGDLSDSSNLGFTAMKRTGDGSGFRVRAQELDPVDGSWAAVALAVCANITTETATSDYAFGPSQAFNVSVTNSVAAKTVTATCPVGQYVIGGGAHVRRANGDPLPSRKVAIIESGPAATGTTVSVWSAEARETDPIDKDWSLFVQVHCADMDYGPPV